MAGLNTKNTRTKQKQGATPITTLAQNMRTFEGAKAYSRDPQGELAMLGLSLFWGEKSFYESADARSVRFRALVHEVAAREPDWILGFIPWLRGTGNIRTASMVGALEGARVMVGKPAKAYEGDLGIARRLVGSTPLRADEPGEMLAYWLSVHGRSMPGAVRRGIGDAATRLYTERAVIKWDKEHAVRMADVIELTHPKPRDAKQAALFRWLVDSRHRATEVPGSLKMLGLNRGFMMRDPAWRNKRLHAFDATDFIRDAGLTWEQVSSSGAFDARKWTALIPTMGPTQLVRNLRNIQEAGVEGEPLRQIMRMLSDPIAIRSSRLFPYQIMSAYIEATASSWAAALDTALKLSTAQIPSLPGRTLVLVDTSGSMANPVSEKSKVTRMMVAALFGMVLAAKGDDVDLVGYGDSWFRHELPKGGSVLREVERFIGLQSKAGNGTQTAKALRESFKGHDRVVIVTDGQTFGPDSNQLETISGQWGRRLIGPEYDVSKQIPEHVPIYAADVAGYKPQMMESGSTRHQIGGLGDATWDWITTVEAGQRQGWPWIKRQPEPHRGAIWFSEDGD